MEVGLLSELYAGDELVAAQFGLRCDPVLAGWHLTYSAALPKYSPGLIPVLHLARAAAASGIHRINMGRGAAEYKAMFSSRDLFVAEGQVVRRSSGRGTALGPVRIGAWLRRFVREHPRLFRAARRARTRGARIDSAVRRRCWRPRLPNLSPCPGGRYGRVRTAFSHETRRRGNRVKIVCVGGGPAGLYFATLMKRRDKEHDITVLERNPAGSTYGWG